MKATHLLMLGALAVGGFLVWKNRAKLVAMVAPDPTVQTLAGSTYGNAQDVNGNIAAALLGVATSAFGTSSSGGATSPALNAALTGSGAGLDYTGGEFA